MRRKHVKSVIILELDLSAVWADANWAAKCDCQQYGVLTIVEADELVNPPFKLRISKRRWASSLTFGIQASSKESNQSARMRRMV